MKSKYSILTRKFLDIDIQVWVGLLIMILVFTGIILIRAITREDCVPFKIMATDLSGSQKNSFYVDETIQFKVDHPGNIHWDFGDGFKETGTSSQHQFFTQGNKNIIASLNGSCSQTLLLNIYPNITANSDSLQINPISGPDAAFSGKKVNFTYIGKDKADSFEWYVENNPDIPTVRQNKATFIFNKSGDQVVTLVLGKQNPKTFHKTIFVSKGDVEMLMPPPPPPPPAKGGKPVAAKDKFISDEELVKLFEQVRVGTKNAQSFTEYLFYGLNTPIIANGKIENFTQGCEKLAKKGAKILSVKAFRDKESHIDSIQLRYRKKLF